MKDIIKEFTTEFKDTTYLVCVIKDTESPMKQEVFIESKELEEEDIYKMLGLVIRKLPGSLDENIEKIREKIKEVVIDE